MIGILWLFLQSAASHLLYLALRLETGSFPKPLSAKEEQAAFAAMRAGDAAARETLICHNLRLVAHIVKKYYTVSGGQDDFISIGTIGLIKAVDTYDCTRTTRFASYASRCIENELRMQLRHTRREAGTVSLQEPLETGADSGMLTLADVLPDLATMEEDCELRDAAAQLRQLVTALPEREQQILTLRYAWMAPSRRRSSRSPHSSASAAAMYPGWKSTPLPACAVRGTNRTRCNCSNVCIL